MPKKTKLQSLEQTTGKEEQFQPTTLEQILGVQGYTKYGTMDEKEYADKINLMPKSDLQMHATKIGIVPIDSRDRLIKTLVNQFRLHVASFRHPTRPSNGSVRQPVSPEVAKILALGR